MPLHRPGVLTGWLEPAAMLAAGIAGTAAVMSASGIVAVGRWLLVPAVWLAAAACPCLWRPDAWEDFRLWPRGWRNAALAALGATAVMAAAAAAGVWALSALGMEWPLRPEVPPGEWLPWSLYQFLYVAVSEEVFFRGYFQSMAERASRRAGRGERASRWAGIVAAAAAFGLAHVAIGASAAGAAVVLPGLAFGWLRAHTGGLAAPIFAHGAANVVYAALSAAL